MAVIAAELDGKLSLVSNQLSTQDVQQVFESLSISEQNRDKALAMEHAEYSERLTGRALGMKGCEIMLRQGNWVERTGIRNVMSLLFPKTIPFQIAMLIALLLMVAPKIALIWSVMGWITVTVLAAVSLASSRRLLSKLRVTDRYAQGEKALLESVRPRHAVPGDFVVAVESGRLVVGKVQSVMQSQLILELVGDAKATVPVLNENVICPIVGTGEISRGSMRYIHPGSLIFALHRDAVPPLALCWSLGFVVSITDSLVVLSPFSHGHPNPGQGITLDYSSHKFAFAAAPSAV